MTFIHSYASRDINEFECEDSGIIIESVLTYNDENCKEFDLFINEEKIGYYYEHHNNPMNNEPLDSVIYEVYYDYDEDQEEFASSYITEDFNDMLEFITA